MSTCAGQVAVYARPIPDSALPPPLFDQFKVGEKLRAIGPAEGTKLGPPQEAEVVGITEKGYKTTGKRQVATLIAFGCERFWQRVGR